MATDEEVVAAAGVKAENECINKGVETKTSNKQAVITTNRIIQTMCTNHYSKRLNDSTKINSPLKIITITSKEASGTIK